MRYRVLLALSMLMAMASPGMAQNEMPVGERFHLEFGTVWWQPSPALSIQTEAVRAGGVSDFDFAEEFNLASHRFSEFRGVVKLAAKHRVRVSYVPVRYENTVPLRRTLSFDDTLFNGVATASVQWNLWRVGYEWDFIARDRAMIGLLADVKYNKVGAFVRGGVLADGLEQKAPIPGLGAVGRFYVHPRVAVAGEFTALKLKAGDIDGKMLDFDVSGTANIFKSFGLVGGYRSVHADYVVDRDSGDLKLQGPYVGIVSRF